MFNTFKGIKINKGFTVFELLAFIAIGITAVFAVGAIISVNKPYTPATQRENWVFYPEPTNYLVDSAEVLIGDEGITLSLKEFDQIAQIAVVTVKTTQPLTIEEYAIKLAEKWKVGYKGLDNGAILLIAVEDRKLRIEVGRGIEGSLTDIEAKTIIDKVIVPYLKEGKWDEGVTAGVETIKQEIRIGD